MYRDANPLAGLADEEGKLFAERSKLELLRGSHTILTPRETQIVKCAAIPCIRYPVPEQWPPEVTNVDLFELIASGLWDWEKGERFSAEAVKARMLRGLHGTRGGTDPSGMLPAFLRLGHDDCSPEELPARVITQVETFVKQWGALWVCRTPAHHIHGRQCYWEPRQAIYWNDETTLCTWCPTEEVYAFVQEARQAKAVVRVIGKLRQGRPVDEELWNAMGVHPPGKSPFAQQIILVRVVEDRLAIHCQVKPMIRLLHSTPPQLHLVSKVGFLPTAWLEIAQILCHAKGIYECSNCGEMYIRVGRQPPKGRNNHCETCREGNRGAARLSMQRKRAREQ